MDSEEIRLIKNADVVKRNYLNPLKTEVMESRQYREQSRQRANGLYQRDYARIMYSSSFRRLQGEMTSFLEIDLPTALKLHRLPVQLLK